MNINDLDIEQLKQIIYNLTLQYQCGDKVLQLSRELRNDSDTSIQQFDYLSYQPPTNYTSPGKLNILIEATLARSKYNNINKEVEDIKKKLTQNNFTITVIGEGKNYGLLGMKDECYKEHVFIKIFKID